MIDLNIIKSLIGNDQTTITQYLQVFEQQTTLDLQKLKDAWEKADWQGVKSSSHRMRSGFKMLGMKDAFDRCESIERIVFEEKHRHLVPGLIALVQEDFELARQDIKGLP